MASSHMKNWILRGKYQPEADNGKNFALTAKRSLTYISTMSRAGDRLRRC
jgi:hypothetical protein